MATLNQEKEPGCSVCTTRLGTLLMYHPDRDPEARASIYSCEGPCRDKLETEGMVVDKVRIPGDDNNPAWWCSTARWASQVE